MMYVVKIDGDYKNADGSHPFVLDDGSRGLLFKLEEKLTEWVAKENLEIFAIENTPYYNIKNVVLNNKSKFDMPSFTIHDGLIKTSKTKAINVKLCLSNIAEKFKKNFHLFISDSPMFYGLAPKPTEDINVCIGVSFEGKQDEIYIKHHGENYIGFNPSNNFSDGYLELNSNNDSVICYTHEGNIFIPVVGLSDDVLGDLIDKAMTWMTSPTEVDIVKINYIKNSIFVNSILRCLERDKNKIKERIELNNNEISYVKNKYTQLLELDYDFNINQHLTIKAIEKFKSNLSNIYSDILNDNIEINNVSSTNGSEMQIDLKPIEAVCFKTKNVYCLKDQTITINFFNGDVKWAKKMPHFKNGCPKAFFENELAFLKMISEYDILKIVKFIIAITLRFSTKLDMSKTMKLKEQGDPVASPNI